MVTSIEIDRRREEVFAYVPDARRRRGRSGAALADSAEMQSVAT
jgi:hypothetical protein